MVNKDILKDDGLYIEEVGRWAEIKYKHIEYYANMFSTGMKKKWDSLIYIDLFAGSGLAKIRNTKRIVAASPLLALSADYKFEKYIFCDVELKKLAALKLRVKSYFPDCDVHYIQGDVNLNVSQINASVPKASRQFKVLSFCVVDPYNLGCLNFATIESIASNFVDFLVLIPSGMDANRNEKVYLSPSNKHVECFLGDDRWRNKWDRQEIKCSNFGDFIVNSFIERMHILGYKPMEVNDFICVRNPSNNSPLYHLGFFSRSLQGVNFWKKTKKYSDPQMKLPFEG